MAKGALGCPHVCRKTTETDIIASSVFPSAVWLLHSTGSRERQECPLAPTAPHPPFIEAAPTTRGLWWQETGRGIERGRHKRLCLRQVVSPQFSNKLKAAQLDPNVL